MTISTDEFRKLRIRVMKQCLEAVGFRREEKNLYLRETPSRQLHSIQFGASRFRTQTFTVDYGFHYAFVPPYNQPGCVAEPDGYSPVHCWFWTRLRKPDNNQTFDYGETAEQTDVVLRDVAGQVLGRLDAFEATWSDGKRLLDTLSPDVMEEYSRTCRLDYSDIDVSFARVAEARKQTRLYHLFPDGLPGIGGIPGMGATCVLLGFIALQHSRLAEADRYRAVIAAEKANGDECPRQAYKALCGLIGKSGAKKK